MKEKGFTLIEVVSSLVIVGIALVAMLGMFSIGSRSNAYNQDKVVACNLLQRKLEEVKCKTFGNINSADGVVVEPLDVDLTDFAGADPPLKRVTVSTSWATPFGGSQAETVSTLIADYE